MPKRHVSAKIEGITSDTQAIDKLISLDSSSKGASIESIFSMTPHCVAFRVASNS